MRVRRVGWLQDRTILILGLNLLLVCRPPLSSLAAAGVKAETLQDMFINATIGTPIGIITMEDVVEELLGSEIIDETDRFVDNMQKQKINALELSNSLPKKLRALLRMGVFTAAIRPGVRAQSDSLRTPLLSQQAGTGSSGDQGVLSPEWEKSPCSDNAELVGVPAALNGTGGVVVPGLGLPPRPPSIVAGVKSPGRSEVAAVVIEGAGTSWSAGMPVSNYTDRCPV